MASPEEARAEGRVPTVAELAERIKSKVGIPWLERTVDGFVVGDPEVRARGIAVVMMATIPVLEEAMRRGLNFILSHEPTFWDHRECVDGLEGDPLYRHKKDLIERNGLSVFHFHDHWHRRPIDGIAYGMAWKLGWLDSRSGDDYRVFNLPGKRLGDLADELAEKLGAASVRAIGDGRAKAERVFASWGFMSRDPGIALLARPDIDVVITGETHEWEAMEYALDASTAGMGKGLVILGHSASESAGMEYCAKWLRDIVPDVPVEYIAQPEPYWTRRS